MSHSNPSVAAQLREILDYPSDDTGECDRCHNVTALWIDNDSDNGPDADRAYCADCWRKIIPCAAQPQAGSEIVTVKVLLAQKDIDRAIAAERFVDPVSLVMHRLVLHRPYSVEFAAGEDRQPFGRFIINGACRNAWSDALPVEVREFLRAFHSGQPVDPIIFEIDLPRHMVRHC